MNEKYVFVASELHFFLTIAVDYKNAARVLVEKSNHPADKFLGYPLQLLLATSFELYIKALIAIDCVLDNKDKEINGEELKLIISSSINGFSHRLDKLFDYKNVKSILGITNVKKEDDGAMVSHYEIYTTDAKFPLIFLKNSESSRYAGFSKKADYGYLHIQEAGSKEEKFAKLSKGEKILDSNDKFIELLEVLDDYSQKHLTGALKEIGN